MQIGIHLDGVPYDGSGSVDEAALAIGPIDIVHWFQAWGGGHRAFHGPWLDDVHRSGRSGLITWEPWALTGEATQAAFTPDTIVAGDHDDYIRGWADAFAARDDGPWFIRPMHEMNGNWYPWGGGDPTVYRAAWAHLHQTFQARGATEVAWVWCPLVDDVTGPFEPYYPGDEQVDVLALDGYNWGASMPENGGWRSVGEVFDAAYDRLAALGPQPIWFAEVGSAADGGDKAAWLTELLRPGRFPRLDTVAFFSLDKERDWRVHHDPTVAEAIRTHRTIDS